MSDAEDQAKELPALVTAILTANRRDKLPAVRSDAEAVDLPPLRAALDVLSNPKSKLPAHARLEALGQLVQARERGDIGADVDLVPLAEALTNDHSATATRSVAAQAMLEQLRRKPVEGKDRLGRAVVGEDLDGTVLPDLVPNLHADLSDVTIVQPLCGIKTTNMDGVPALNIITDVKTRRPLSDFYAIVNPFEWTQCALESSFFTQMQPVPPGAQPGATLPPDEGGWTARLLEVVDFGLGFGPPQTCQTQLNFVFFFKPTDSGQLGCAGSTYDFHRSLDGQISVDQGFLLAEDLGPNDARGFSTRYRTQKLVHMKNSPPANDDVCDVWSAIVGVLIQGCSGGPPVTLPTSTTPTSTAPTSTPPTTP